MKNKLLNRLGQEKLLEELALEGSASKVAKKHNVSFMTAYAAYNLIGVDYNLANILGKTYTKELLEKDYLEYGSCKLIANKYGVSHEFIRTKCREWNIDNKFIKYKADEDFFSRETEESFYVAGFVSADGDLSRIRNHVRIGLALKDIDQLVMIKRLFQAENPILCSKVDGSIYNKNYSDWYKCELRISSKTMVKDLEKFNVFPQKTFTNTFPIHLAEHPLIHHFMRGYFDGDGSFYEMTKKKNEKTTSIAIDIKGTPEFLGAYRLILDALVFKRTKQPGYSRMVGKIADLQYGGNGLVKQLADFLYKDARYYLERKHNLVKDLIIQHYHFNS